ncbi:MAG TPA: hypothetical protein VFV38_39020 [Ktedonobacteraceae bacterium]|nr:hypothetical protein [Ktedonobacteraceae bacterium]
MVNPSVPTWPSDSQTEGGGFLLFIRYIPSAAVSRYCTSEIIAQRTRFMQNQNLAPPQPETPLYISIHAHLTL